ncbi:MAG: septal ring lytic transglycosylase RlpA family protein [Acidobacteria bacterium]|nr:septal ring lytic transglycosylase RlpA family protein [Acidobacteriota bacterium]
MNPGPTLRLRCCATLGILACILLMAACARPRSGPRGLRSGSPGGAYEEVGEASWYGGAGDGFAGRPTASGEIFDPSKLTCAHRTLPLGTYLEVENLANGRRAVLRVNDRGPFAHGRILDASRAGAQELGFLGAGIARVRIRSVDAGGAPAALDPRADREDPFTVQVAALSDPANIGRLSEELRNLGLEVTHQEVSARPGVKRIRAGRFESREEAERAARDLARRLRGLGVDPFVTRVR